MKSFLILFAYLFAHTEAVTCPDRQEYKQCGSACPPSCDELNPNCIQLCTEGCFCTGDYVLNDWGECITVDECGRQDATDYPIFDSTDDFVCCEWPESHNGISPCWEGCICCPDGSVSYSIGDGTTFSCPGLGTVKRGIDDDKFGVFCDDIFESTEDFGFGSTEEIECGPYEVFNECSSACPDKCDDPPIKFCILPCIRGCECKPGYVLNEEYGECIPYDECPTTTSEEPIGCCDRDEYNTMVNNFQCREGCQCCPDGSIVQSMGDASTYPCPGGDLTAGEDIFGKFCDEIEPSSTEDGEIGCCDPADFDLPHCWEGCACCPDGTVVGSWGDGKTFGCYDGSLTLVKGKDDDKFGELCENPSSTNSDCACYEIYMPYCCDGVEYSNDCFARCAGFDVDKDCTRLDITNSDNKCEIEEPSSTEDEPCDVKGGCGNDANTYGLTMVCGVIVGVFGWM